ncbi:MAG TPA: hypothetical protein VJU82_08485 [Acidobacteriaceae bacterium]|nr:hypothetical protein [Acidobacteriaceae bacterium]
MPQSVGNGTTLKLRTNAITGINGTFPTVTGVTSESDGTANSFSLQINSNTFSTWKCSSFGGGPNCVGWQQFVFENNGSAAWVYMQYWLIGFGVGPCPTGGTVIYQHSTQIPTACFGDSAKTSVPVQTINSSAALASLALGGAVGAGLDTASVAVGSTAYSANGSSSELNLSNNWNEAEFNLFGDGGGKTATFNGGAAGVTVGINMAVAHGGSTAAAPVCGTGGIATAEQNNLTLVPGSCCPYRGVGSTPGLTFLETSSTGVRAPFCLITQFDSVVSGLR